MQPDGLEEGQRLEAGPGVGPRYTGSQSVLNQMMTTSGNAQRQYYQGVTSPATRGNIAAFFFVVGQKNGGKVHARANNPPHRTAAPRAATCTKAAARNSSTRWNMATALGSLAPRRWIDCPLYCACETLASW